MAATPSLGGARSGLVRARQNLCCQVTLVAGTFPPPKSASGTFKKCELLRGRSNDWMAEG